MVYSRHAYAHKSVHRGASLRKHAVHRSSPGSGVGANHNHHYDGLIARAPNRYGVDPALVKAIICKESRFNPRAQSEAGARGLMQMMPDTARGLGVKDPFNPEQNVMAGTRYIGQLLKPVSYTHLDVYKRQGLGLPFVAQVAELHGGRAELREREGGGTVALLLLPA